MATGQLQDNQVRDGVAPGALADWFHDYAGIHADSILSFCKTHDIVSELKDAVAIAEKCFSPSSIRLEDDIDPETNDRTVVIAVTILNKTPQDVVASYREFRKQMIAALPRAKNEFICLAYDVSESKT